MGNSVRTLTADRIILSAGAIESAKLLLLSGLGPADELHAVGVQPIVDLPGVGTRVMDHAEWVLDTGQQGQQGHPVLDTVLHTDRSMGLEIRPYTKPDSPPWPEP
ncbi:putative dehydrogenase [Mycobacteroides abscessus subsp. abscessus]|nr:putative dehydrogenase [Mycobacteroides abscessus subsp. abscessus]